MARPIKQGLEYFALDVVMNDKVKIIESLHGHTGFSIFIKLLQKIYSEGYYTKWNKKEQLLFSNSANLDINTLNNIVRDCIEWDLFDKELFEKYEILTSKRIQNHYLAATYKRSNVELILEYLLVEVSKRNNVSIISITDINNSTATIQSDINYTQSKVKESKVKKRKEKERGENKLSSPTPPISPISQIISLWNSKDKLPKIKKITNARVKHIEERLQEHDLDTILEVVERCNNSKFLCGQNNRNWIVTFDWLFGNSENFLKVLEGNYDDKKKKFTVPEWYKDYEANLEFSSKQDDYSDEERQKIVEEAKELLGGKYDFSN